MTLYNWWLPAFFVGQAEIHPLEEVGACDAQRMVATSRAPPPQRHSQGGGVWRHALGSAAKLTKGEHAPASGTRILP